MVITLLTHSWVLLRLSVQTDLVFFICGMHALIYGFQLYKRCLLRKDLQNKTLALRMPLQCFVSVLSYGCPSKNSGYYTLPASTFHISAIFTGRTCGFSCDTTWNYAYFSTQRLFCNAHAVLSKGETYFRARSQNCEKRLLVSSCPSVRPQGTHSDFDKILCFWTFFTEICRENSRFIKIPQE